MPPRRPRPPAGPVALDPEDVPTYLALARAGCLWRSPAGLHVLAADTGHTIPLVRVLHAIPRRYRVEPVHGDPLDLRRRSWRFARGSRLPGLRRRGLPAHTPAGLVDKERRACRGEWATLAPSRDPRAYLVAPRTTPIRCEPPAFPRLVRDRAGNVHASARHPVTGRWHRLGSYWGDGAARDAVAALHTWWARVVAPDLPPPAEPTRDGWRGGAPAVVAFPDAYFRGDPWIASPGSHEGDA